MNRMKSRLFALVDKKGNLIAASFALPQAPGVPQIWPEPSNPGHTLHEIEVTDELASRPSVEAIKTTVAKHLKKRPQRVNIVKKSPGKKS